MKVEVYSDVVCPWCYIGERRFAEGLRLAGLESGEDAVEVVFRPYQLDPSMPAEGVPLVAWLESRYGPAAKAMRDRAGAVAAAGYLEEQYARAFGDPEAAMRNEARKRRVTHAQFGAPMNVPLFAAMAWAARGRPSRSAPARSLIATRATAHAASR